MVQDVIDDSLESDIVVTLHIVLYHIFLIWGSRRYFVTGRMRWLDLFIISQPTMVFYVYLAARNNFRPRKEVNPLNVSVLSPKPIHKDIIGALKSILRTMVPVRTLQKIIAALKYLLIVY